MLYHHLPRRDLPVYASGLGSRISLTSASAAFIGSAAGSPRLVVATSPAGYAPVRPDSQAVGVPPGSGQRAHRMGSAASFTKTLH